MKGLRWDRLQTVKVHWIVSLHCWTIYTTYRTVIRSIKANYELKVNRSFYRYQHMKPSIGLFQSLWKFEHSTNSAHTHKFHLRKAISVNIKGVYHCCRCAVLWWDEGQIEWMREMTAAETVSQSGSDTGWTESLETPMSRGGGQMIHSSFISNGGTSSHNVTVLWDPHPPPHHHCPDISSSMGLWSMMMKMISDDLCWHCAL